MVANFEIEKTIIEAVENDQHLYLDLDDKGHINIDKPLPYIMVYRIPHEGKDLFSYKLSHTEASFIIGRDGGDDFCAAINTVAKKMSEKFGAFMILEVWMGEHTTKRDDFEIKISSDAAKPIAEKMVQELQNIRLKNTRMRASMEKVMQVKPPYYERILKDFEIDQDKVMIVGLEIFPNYINPETGKPFPIFLRSLRKDFGIALKKTFYEFIRVHTSLPISNFHMLGTTEIDDLVWKLDDELADISENFDFLFLTSPVNHDEAWDEFKKNKFRKAPFFSYKYLPMDPEFVKRRLYNLPIEKVKDPTIASLLREKRGELDKMMNMFLDRDTKDFLYSSMQLFGGVDENLLDIAEAILIITPTDNEAAEDEVEGPTDDEELEEEYIGAEEFASIAKKEMEYLKEQCPLVEPKVDIVEDVESLMVSSGKLFIGKDYKIHPKRVDALIQHEVGTHVATYYNGKSQPFKLLYSGVPGYEELQEGLAVLSEYIVGGLTNSRLRTLAARVVGVYQMMNGHSFVDTFNLLTGKYNFKPKQAFALTTRVYRAGGLTKDAVYLKGLIDLLKYLHEGNEIEPLLIGKIRQDYLPIMQELIYRKILKQVPIKPRYLSEKYQGKLEKLKEGITVFNMVQT